MSANVLRREECTNCVKDYNKDNRVVYSDGGYYCYACNDCKPGKGKAMSKEITDLLPVQIEAVPERGLTLATCQKYGIGTSTNKYGEDVYVFPVYEGNKAIKQKIRSKAEKKFTQVGDLSNERLFGQHLFSPSKNVPIIITEGEWDAASAFQMTTYPAVSGVKGAQGLHKELAANMEWLAGWKHVVLCLDTDEAGQKAASQCAELFEPGTVRIAHLPLKDCSDMLQAGRVDEVKKAIWNAAVLKPDTIVGIMDIIEEALVVPKLGIPYPWPSLTKITYGYRFGELLHVFGPTGCGKTEFIAQIVENMLSQGINGGLFSLEERAADKLRRMAGKKLNCRLHIPGEPWPEESVVREAMMSYNDRVHIYDSSSGVLTLSKIAINMRYMAKVFNTRLFVLDNLKALAANAVIDGKVVPDYMFMSHVVSQLFLLTRELNATIILVNHVKKKDVSISAKVSSYDMQNGWDVADALNAEGTTWETGMMPNANDIYGGGNINDLVDYTIALTRNTVSSNPLTKRTLRAKILKSRLDSRYTGYTWDMLYDYTNGQLEETGER